MMHRLLALLALLTIGLTLVWGQAEAAIAIISGSGTGGSLGNSNAATLVAATLVTNLANVDVPPTSLVIIAASYRVNAAIVSATDSAATPNTYSAQATTPSTTTNVRVFYSYTASDLPAPCTLTASETSTTLVVTALGGTCASGTTFTNGQSISGGSFVGSFNGSCTVTTGSLPVTCSVNNGAVVASGTATVSSTITVTYNSSTGGKAQVVVAFSGAASTPADATSTTTGTSAGAGAVSIGPTPTSGNLATAADVLIADWSYSTNQTITEASGFTSLGTITTGSDMHAAYEIVSSNSAVTYAPSVAGAAGTYTAMLQAFKPPSLSPVRQSCTLLGVC